jgi:hypothetical protein
MTSELTIFKVVYLSKEKGRLIAPFFSAKCAILSYYEQGDRVAPVQLAKGMNKNALLKHLVCYLRLIKPLNYPLYGLSPKKQQNSANLLYIKRLMASRA